MTSRRQDLPGCPLLPSDARPCVWMVAGLVAYRLCDCDYDCENCAFDAALRGGGGRPRAEGANAPGGTSTPTATEPGAPEESRSPVSLGSRGGAPACLDDRRYGGRHGWVRPAGGRRVRCGVDAFAAKLLGHVSGVVLPLLRSRVRRGRIACWLRDEKAVIPLRSPIDGIVRRVNEQLQNEPSLLARDPYGAGWLLEAECRIDPAELPGLIGAREQERRSERDLTRLRELALHGLKRDTGIGPTLADGGPPLEDLRSILGPERYRRLVLAFLD